MDSFETRLNDLLVRAHRSLEIIEGQMLREGSGLNLTISEIHLLEAVGPPAKDKPGTTVSEVSEALGISLPSVTLAVNKLVAKGYLTKQRSGTDGRVVYLRLTRSGQKAEHAHRYFHRRMVRAIAAGLSAEEKQSLMKGIENLNAFFDARIETGGA